MPDTLTLNREGAGTVDQETSLLQSKMNTTLTRFMTIILAATLAGLSLSGSQDRSPEEVVESRVPATPDPAPAVPADRRRDIERMFAVHHPLVDRWTAWAVEGRGRLWLDTLRHRWDSWAPRTRRWLREEGVPGDLVWLAVVESGLDPWAVSSAGARGMWQFMGPTGRAFGLLKGPGPGPAVDRRHDPELSTRAAARYLAALHESFGSWELALAAYNAGPARVRRALRHGDSFWAVAGRPGLLPRETRNHVPKVVAVRRAWERVLAEDGR